MKKVIVVGGGAAGMMAAYAAAQNQNEVLLLEKNEKLGKKIYITGKGRCNFSNASDMDEFFKQIVSNPRFLYSAMSVFNNEDMMQFLNQQGVAYKIERGNRLFPESDHASDITDALKRGMNERHVKVRLNCMVKEIAITDGEEPSSVTGVFIEDAAAKETFLPADAVIIATGGLSYPKTGSTGDGYLFAKKTGHRMIPCRPALVPLETKEAYILTMQGLALKNVTLSFYSKKGENAKEKKIYSGFGEMLFTHFGISGPLVLSASSVLGKYLEEKKTIRGEIDLKPALNEEQLNHRILKEIDENKNKQIGAVLSKLLPSSMVSVMIGLLKIDETIKNNALTKENRQQLIFLLKHFPLTVLRARSYNEAIITQGGICVKDIDPKTMQSKKVGGLYFAGEVMDVDAYTGGYNLQIAFSTGYLAGNSIA